MAAPGKTEVDVGTVNKRHEASHHMAPLLARELIDKRHGTFKCYTK